MNAKLSIGEIVSALIHGRTVQCDFVDPDNHDFRVCLEFGYDENARTLYAIDLRTCIRLVDWNLAKIFQPLKWITIDNTENYSIA
jgi:hypothetical protein